MLFDLRGRGRRRVVKIIYGGLAILLGGGLVLFGIGGDVQGGLFDAFREDGGGDGSSQIKEQVETAEERARRTPREAGPWAELARARYQYAGVGKGINEGGTFTETGKRRLREADQAWQRHLSLAGQKPSAEVAAIMSNVYTEIGLNQPEKGVRAQEIVLDANEEPGFGDYAKLAVLAYQAKQMRKGDLARSRALELAPKDQREALKAQLDQAKSGGTEAAPQTPAAGTPTQPTG